MTVLDIAPATPARWDDLVGLFGPNGAYANCWCTWWILASKGWDRATPQERRHVLADRVADGAEPGLIAYRDGLAVGWVAVGPREGYARMMSRRAIVYRPPDDRPSWVINCFFIHRDHRRSGIASALLKAAVDHAFARGATRIDAYPIDRDHTDAATLFVGSLGMFTAAGFVEVERVRDRPLVRLTGP